MVFISHLILEKALKAYWVFVFEEVPPKIHDLLKLALKTNIKLNESQLRFLDAMNKFNLETRYPEHKSEMYKICDFEYTTKQFSQVMELYNCIKFLLI